MRLSPVETDSIDANPPRILDRAAIHNASADDLRARGSARARARKKLFTGVRCVYANIEQPRAVVRSLVVGHIRLRVDASSSQSGALTPRLST